MSPAFSQLRMTPLGSWRDGVLVFYLILASIPCGPRLEACAYAEREPVRMGGHGWKVILRAALLSNLSLVKVSRLEHTANELKSEKAG